jgi:hypothetical protein
MIVVVVLIVLVIIDVSAIRIYDYVSKLFVPASDKVILFAITSVACLAAEFILFEFIRPL